VAEVARTRTDVILVSGQAPRGLVADIWDCPRTAICLWNIPKPAAAVAKILDLRRPNQEVLATGTA